MLSLFLAVAVSASVPASCSENVRELQVQAEVLLAEVMESSEPLPKPFRVKVVSRMPADMLRESPVPALAWVKRGDMTIYMRRDFVCVSSSTALKMTLAHEICHLVSWDLTHEEIASMLQSAFFMQNVLAEDELTTITPRMAAWTQAQERAKAVNKRRLLHWPGRLGRALGLVKPIP